MWTDVKHGNTLDASWNITSLKCKHTEWWYSQQEAVLFYEQGKQLSICPHTPTDWKLKHWNPLHREHDLLASQDGQSVPAIPGNKILRVPCISELPLQTPAFSYKQETLERVIFFRNLIFLQHTLHYGVLLHNSNSYLCFACLFCLSGVHHQVFVDKISRDGCSTYCQLTFLVANYWENKQHAVEIFIQNCSYEVLFTKTWE